MAPLTNTKVLIIGGSSGIGFSVAKQALAEGATVIIASSSKDKLQAAANRLGNPEKVLAEQVDIESEESIRALFQRISELDHLVITAGRLMSDSNGSIHTTDLLAKRGIFDGHYWGSLLAVQLVLPLLQKSGGGSITFTSSVSALRPPPGRGHLLGIAGAIASMTNGLALDLAADNVRVNTIAPGLVDTEIFDFLPKDQKKTILEGYLPKIPLNRIGAPEELAEAYIFAMKCTFLTGQTIYVEGGQLVK